ncbi:MAG: hypothetical protein ABSF83_13770 [Nitrososphaerales archaeon]
MDILKKSSLLDSTGETFEATYPITPWLDARVEFIDDDHPEPNFKLK